MKNTKEQLHALTRRLFFDVAANKLQNPHELYATIHNAMVQTEDEETADLLNKCLDLIAQDIVYRSLEAHGWTCINVEDLPVWQHN